MSISDFVKLQVRLPREVHERLQELAQREERSLNGQIVYLLRQGIEAHEELPEDEGKAAA